MRRSFNTLLNFISTCLRSGIDLRVKNVRVAGNDLRCDLEFRRYKIIYECRVKDTSIHLVVEGENCDCNDASTFSHLLSVEYSIDRSHALATDLNLRLKILLDGINDEENEYLKIRRYLKAQELIRDTESVVHGLNLNLSFDTIMRQLTYLEYDPMSNFTILKNEP